MDAMHMGVVLLDAKLDTLIVNKAYRELSRIPDGAVTVGAPFSLLMELNRRNGIYGDSTNSSGSATSPPASRRSAPAPSRRASSPTPTAAR